MEHQGDRTPIGMALWRTTRVVMGAFDQVLAEHGGNRPVWFLFLALDDGEHHTQRDLARAIGIKESTLTHHLAALEERGLLARHRDPDDRRVQRIEFTAQGRETFRAMKLAAIAYEQKVRAALGPDGVTSLQSGLAALVDAIRESGPDDRSLPLE